VSEVFPVRPALPEHKREKLVHIDPTLGIEEARLRWETRTAQWRARELAETIFGGEVSARLSGHTVRSGFRGLLHLDVPFTSLERHRSLEAVFLAVAARDPVLCRVPLVFVVGPGPA
jgi:hypothetical protein